MTLPTVVVGAGLSGLTAAWTLARAGERVLLLEDSARPGGAVRTERVDGFLLETGPNTVRPAPALWRLIQELGLAGDVLRTDPRTPRYVDFRGNLHRVPLSPPQILTTKLLSASAKLRLLGEPFRPCRGDADESVADFVARRLGRQVADRLVEPFVAGIFAGEAARLSVGAAFPTLARWERDHGSLLRGAIADRPGRSTDPAAPRGLVSFRDGLETLPRTIAARLGDALRPATPVENLAPAPGGWTLQTPSGEVRARRVVVAAPAFRAARLVFGFAPGASRALEGIPHPPLVVLHLGWPETASARPLHGFGHLVVPDRDRRILGAVWSSSLFPARAPAGQVLLTVFLGGSRDPAAFELSDEALFEIAARDLVREGLLRGTPRLLRATRWAHAIPQYVRGHADRIAELERTEGLFPGLVFLGNYRGGISVPDVVAAASAISASPNPTS